MPHLFHTCTEIFGIKHSCILRDGILILNRVHVYYRVDYVKWNLFMYILPYYKETWALGKANEWIKYHISVFKDDGMMQFVY